MGEFQKISQCWDVNNNRGIFAKVDYGLNFITLSIAHRILLLQGIRYDR
jgi:hypothetical protein